MPKRKAPTMDVEFLEYLKFLHLHGLVDIITIIESVPIYYQTQVRRIIEKNNNYDSVVLEKLKLQNLTYIAKYGFDFGFTKFNFEFQTHRVGPYSLDIENELQNIVNSDVFNNAVSSARQFAKRYRIKSYDKEMIINMFKTPNNYRHFLEIAENKDVLHLADISHTLFFHNRIQTSAKSKAGKNTNRYKNKKLAQVLKNVVSWKKDYNTYINNLVKLALVISDINQQQERSLQNQS